MAHLLTSAFNKPAPFDSRTALLPTPPDTDPDASFAHAVPPHTLTPPSHVSEQDAWVSPNLTMTPEVATNRAQRVSTLSYRNTPGLRDGRDRTAVRQSKWLVVVFPPVSVIQQHGHLGHTLSLGPSSRLSQGMLMPLFPTMYGQLAVIAREFNFPSIAGLCLYLQVNESGFMMSPRISDENWSILWGHLSEARTPASQQQLPICGRIEFDIDLTKARWWDSWLASSRRTVESLPSFPPSVAHLHGGSKTTFQEDQAEEDVSEPSFAPARHRTGRHVPRKLSLVDRLDTMSLGSSALREDDSTENRARNSLTPITQEEDTKPAGLDLESRVRSWRASSSVTPSPLVNAGQPGLDPINMPNTVVLDDSLELSIADGRINLEDFNWSASSQGPPQYCDDDTPASSPRVPSVHVDRRLEGSVLLTPTTATSWGPDYDSQALSPISTIQRLSSPDMAYRMLEDVPPTPVTATSWGPPSEYPSSPLLVSRPPSVDLTQRLMGSRPPTPSTATTWGPPSQWPPTPAWYRTWDPPRSSDLGDRGSMSMPGSPRIGQGMSFPYFRAEAGGWQHVWPFTGATKSTSTWRFVWPYCDSSIIRETADGTTIRGSRSNSCHPNGTHSNSCNPFTHETCANTVTYPHFEIYPGHICQMQSVVDKVAPVRLQPKYPILDIYPVIYPHIEVYLTLPADINAVQPSASPLGAYVCVKLDHVYPAFQLYESVYPFNLDDIYPVRVHDSPSDKPPATTRLSAQYPSFNIYPPICSHVEPYTRTAVPKGLTSSVVELRAVAPISSDAVYPDFDLYPAGGRTLPPDHRALAGSGRMSVPEQIQVWPTAYPAFQLYPPVYPHFDLYTSMCSHQSFEISVARPVPLHIDLQYPLFVIYPFAYPNFDLYPSSVASRGYTLTDIDLRLTPYYPFLSIYVPTYPAFEIYPGHITSAACEHIAHDLNPGLQPVYPRFDLYPAVFPYFDIYCTGRGYKVDEIHSTVAFKAPVHYPAIHLYSPMYPHFELWSSIRLGEISTQRPDQRRRTHAELHYEMMTSHTVAPSLIPRDRIRTHAELHEEVVRELRTNPDLGQAQGRQEEHVAVNVPAPIKSDTHANVKPGPPSPSQLPVRTGRSRSGTISSKPAPTPTHAPTLPLPSSFIPVLSTPVRTSPISPQSTPPSSASPVSSPSGSSSRRTMPPVMKRFSSTRPTSAFIPTPTSLSPVDEDVSLANGASALGRSRSMASQGTPARPRKRDSLVLERIKLFENPPPADAPARITMKALSQFPLPPAPPVPHLP